MYKVMMGEKANLLEVILYYQIQAFKDRFNPKVKKNHVPFGMLFTHIMRDVEVDVSRMTLSARETQLKGMTFTKMGIADNFPEYAQKHIKKKGQEG